MYDIVVTKSTSVATVVSHSNTCNGDVMLVQSGDYTGQVLVNFRGCFQSLSEPWSNSKPSYQFSSSVRVLMPGEAITLIVKDSNA